LTLDRAVKMTVFLKNAGDFQAMNEVYAKFFTGVPPARTTVQAVLPNEAAPVEIDVIALQ
jgi:2-iminobutanoate/2-iminopropanoate deaminase